MKPVGLKVISAADFKAPERAKIAAAGYTIIANLGDQPSDLAGGNPDDRAG
jgi:putative acid phosphatase of HAD superfamily subfamily IIIB